MTGKIRSIEENKKRFFELPDMTITKNDGTKIVIRDGKIIKIIHKNKYKK